MAPLFILKTENELFRFAQQNPITRELQFFFLLVKN